MKIYQIVANQSDGEDYRTWVVGTYLNKTKAEQDKCIYVDRELKRRQQAAMCDGCGYYDLSKEDFGFFDLNEKGFIEIINDAKDYCDKASYDFDKSNYCQSMIYFDFDIDYVVEEFEVIE